MNPLRQSLRTFIIAAVLVVGLAAQEVTTLITIPQTNRQDTFTSAQATVPDTVQPAGSVLRFRANIAAGDLTNAAHTLAMSLWVFDSVAGTFRLVAGVTWQGGPGAGQPAFELPYDEVRGRLVRVEYSIPVRMRIGGMVEIGPES